MTAVGSLPLHPVDAETCTNEDFRLVLAYADAAEAPIALTGIAFALQGRATRDAHEAAFAASSGAGTITIGGAGNGTLTVAVPVATMRRVPPAVYVVDIVATADGISRRVADGTVTVVRGITR